MKNYRFEVFTSLMIALVTILSAVTAWRASAASRQAGNADFEGLAASIRAQDALIFNSVGAYEHYRSFTTYFRYNELGNIMYADAAADTRREQSDLWEMALGLQYSFFNPRYLELDGLYDVQRELDEVLAEASQAQDLNPILHFDRADQFRIKSSYLTGTLIIFAVSFFLFALGQAIQNNLRYLIALGGMVVLLGGICAAAVFEFTY